VVEKARGVRVGVNGCLLGSTALNDVVVWQLAQM
jgi:hypothetical protein